MSTPGKSIETPRRSLRLSKIDTPLKENVPRSVTKISTPTKATPRRISRKILGENTENNDVKTPPGKKDDSPNFKQQQKKRNKKSKKQKAKANQKRKETRKAGENVSTESETVDTETTSNYLLDSGVTATDESQERSVESQISSPQIQGNSMEIIDLISPDPMVKEITQNSQIEPSFNELESLNAVSTVEEKTIDGSTFEIIEPGKRDQKIATVISNVPKITVQAPTPIRKPQLGAPRFSSTPARKSIASRKATPYKSILEDSIKTVSAGVATPTPKKIVASVLPASVLTPVTVQPQAKTPLKSVLRCSRRSFSVDDVDLNTTARNRVIFHSPANTTISIDQVDQLMKSKKKPIAEEEVVQIKGGVTIRRKRSLSVAETESEKALVQALQANSQESASKKIEKRNPTPSSRAKTAPNFAAIHQQNFDKMESILDHLSRKAERAKVLSSSKSKQGLNKSDSENKPLKKDLKRLQTSKTHPVVVSKARQKIELSMIEVVKKPNAPVSKPLSVINSNKSILSQSKTITEKPIVKKNGLVKSTVPKVTEQKADRQTHHMSMFKANSRANTTVSQEDRKEYIHGVRSNRRFVLQMQHRDRLKK